MIYNRDIMTMESAMRILIDLNEARIKTLARICESRELSRAEIIRREIDQFIATQTPPAVNVFGLWKDSAVDGLD